MRKFFYLAAVLAVAATACNKTESDGSRNIISEESDLTVRIVGAAANTKATIAGIDRENAVNTIDVFVFHKGGAYDGQLDAFGHFTPSGDNAFTREGDTFKGTLKTSTGNKTIYAVVNYDALNGSDSDTAENRLKDAQLIQHEGQLLARLTTLGNQKAIDGSDLNNFTMAGNVTRDLVAGSNSVAVSVDRFVTRVRVKKFTHAFESAALNRQVFTIEEMYLSNAVTKDKYNFIYDLTDDATVTKNGSAGSVNVKDIDGYEKLKVADMANKQGVIPGTNPYALWLNRPFTGSNAITWTANPSRTAGQSESVTTPDNEAFYLYTMPNSSAVDVDGTVADADYEVQNTKLVIRATLNGETMYYAIPLGGTYTGTYNEEYTPGVIQPNFTYDFEEIVFTRPGSSDPNARTVVSGIDFELTVNPWTISLVETSTGKYVI